MDKWWRGEVARGSDPWGGHLSWGRKGGQKRRRKIKGVDKSKRTTFGDHGIGRVDREEMWKEVREITAVGSERGHLGGKPSLRRLKLLSEVWERHASKKKKWASTAHGMVQGLERREFTS